MYKDVECKVENGRYGPFIRYDKTNVKIPKEFHEKIKDLSDADRVKIVESAPAPTGFKKSWGKKQFYFFNIYIMDFVVKSIQLQSVLFNDKNKLPILLHYFI